MLCRICMVHIQRRKHVLDRTDYTAPTWQQHELDHIQSSGIYLACLADVDHELYCCCRNRFSVEIVKYYCLHSNTYQCMTRRTSALTVVLFVSLSHSFFLSVNWSALLAFAIYISYLSYPVRWQFIALSTPLTA